MDNLGDMFRQKLHGNLTPEEQSELAALITPRLAHLCAKAFGEEVAPLFEPYLQDDYALQGGLSHASIQNFKGA